MIGTSAGDQSLAPLLSALRWTDVVATVARPRLFEDLPDMPDRLRGGLGRALERMMDRAGTLSAWDLLFGDAYRSIDPTPPYVIRVNHEAAHILITVRLFGVGCCLAADIAEALESALKVGIALKTGGRRIRLHTEALAIVGYRGVERRPTPATVHLHLVTPLAIRSGGKLLGDVKMIPPALYRRAVSIARWHDVPMISPTASEGHEHVEMVGGRVTSWRRRSSTETSHGMPLGGLTGVVRIERPDPTLWTCIGAAELFHFGAMTAMGLGRTMVVGF